VSDTVLDETWTNVLELKEQDIDVIHVIHVEHLTYFTFEGLKRRLKIHPETLFTYPSAVANDFMPFPVLPHAGGKEKGGP